MILAQESEARFIINEELFGQPKTVVGTTNALSGELTVDRANPSASVIGPIQIDAGTFVTDNNRRNGAIQRFILQSSRHRFITFNPTALSGLPDAAAIGDEIQFEITGDLTVRDITAPVLFTVTMQIVSESELRGAPPPSWPGIPSISPSPRCPVSPTSARSSSSSSTLWRGRSRPA